MAPRHSVEKANHPEAQSQVITSMAVTKTAIPRTTPQNQRILQDIQQRCRVVLKNSEVVVLPLSAVRKVVRTKDPLIQRVICTTRRPAGQSPRHPFEHVSKLLGLPDAREVFPIALTMKTDGTLWRPAYVPQTEEEDDMAHEARYH